MPFGASASFAQSAPSNDDAGQKAADLLRARAAGDVSPDRVVVVYRATASASDAARTTLRQQLGARLLRSDPHGTHEVVRAPAANATSLAAHLKQQPEVLDAYPDRVVHAHLAATDPLASQEWGLGTIAAPTAWDTTLGQGVNVAVLDCGIHASHPDLAGQVGLEQNFTAAATADDLCNHGTHVAGTIAAVLNNGIGVAGVAPAAHLLNGKVLDDSGSGFLSDIDTGIQWAADNGAKVINMSLGGPFACDSVTQSAIDYAWNKGVVIVAAAGNNGASGAEAPANCQNVIGVAATDQNDAMASFSNYGSGVEVAAPGVSVESTVNPSLNGGSQYARFSGTSMATPHAAGVAALIWSTRYGTSAAAVRDRLFATADHISGTGSNWTYGRIDAAAAVAGGAPSTPTPTPTPSPTATASATPSATAPPSLTATPTPTQTASPTATPSPTSSAPSPAPTASPTPPAAPSPTPSLPSPMQLLAQPQRLADTRLAGGAIPTGTTRCFAAAGQGGIPSDAAGVLLNVTAAGETTRGWLSVYPSGQPVPATSTLNFDPSAYAIANGTVARLGPDGQVCVSVGTINGAPGGAQVILDVTGYLGVGGLPQLTLLRAPQRLADSRTNGGALPGGTSRCFAVGGLEGIPADAAAVVLNVTATGQTAPGWFSLYPAGQSAPSTSSLNFAPTSYAIANTAVVRLGSGGQVCATLGTLDAVPGSAHIILDATGYLPATGLAQLPMLPSPQRVADTRTSGGPLPMGSTRCFAVAGLDGVPSNASGVILNVTAVGYGTQGWLTVFPAGQPLPPTSTLNFDPSEYAIGNAALVRLGTNGQVCVNVGANGGATGSSQVILDVMGSFSA